MINTRHMMLVSRKSIQLMRTRRLCHWVPKGSYHIRTPHKEWESKQIYLIHRNKCKETTKMDKQRNNPQIKKGGISRKKK